MPDRERGEGPWLVLIHQLPAEPSRVRVRTWRRLQGIGAVAIKNSVYVLPDSAEAREDFEWIRSEIAAHGGEAVVFCARGADGISSEEIREAVEAARSREWRELQARARKLLGRRGKSPKAGEEAAAEIQREARALQSRAARLDRIDPLKAPGRAEALEEISRIEKLIRPAPAPSAGRPGRRPAAGYAGRVWMTRPRPGIDRLASAWLIRRFVDPAARFQFGEKVPSKGEVVPFDMFGVDLGHRGDKVTFETIMEVFGLGDPALDRLARIVHEVDLKVDPPSDPESTTVERLVEGLRAAIGDDMRLLDHGVAVFEALYRSFTPPDTRP